MIEEEADEGDEFGMLQPPTLGRQISKNANVYEEYNSDDEEENS